MAARDLRLRDRHERLRARGERLRPRDLSEDAWALAAAAQSQLEEQQALTRELAREAAEATLASLALVPSSAPVSSPSPRLPATISARLAPFRAARVAEIAKLTDGLNMTRGRWPELAGCLVILFTARSGSTFLSREVEGRFDLGRVGESLNPAQLRARPLATRLAPRTGRWFGCKAGVQGVVAGELAGFFEAYLERTVFLQLARRDVVAQAVSLDKAERTGGWHGKAEGADQLAYDAGRISHAVEIIIGRFHSLRRFAELTGRPRRTVIYEDISAGDTAAADKACADLGVRHRPANQTVEPRFVERAGDALNADWKSRFEAEMGSPTRDMIERYVATL